MTLYKIFKENEEKLISGVKHMEILTYDFVEENKQSQLAQIDGFIAMVEESYAKGIEKIEGENIYNAMNENLETGYNLALSDLKDKLSADRKLIEEDK